MRCVKDLRWWESLLIVVRAGNNVPRLLSVNQSATKVNRWIFVNEVSSNIGIFNSLFQNRPVKSEKDMERISWIKLLRITLAEYFYWTTYSKPFQISNINPGYIYIYIFLSSDRLSSRNDVTWESDKNFLHTEHQTFFFFFFLKKFRTSRVYVALKS